MFVGWRLSSWATEVLSAFCGSRRWFRALLALCSRVRVHELVGFLVPPTECTKPVFECHMIPTEARFTPRDLHIVGFQVAHCSLRQVEVWSMSVFAQDKHCVEQVLDAGLQPMDAMRIKLFGLGVLEGVGSDVVLALTRSSVFIPKFTDGFSIIRVVGPRRGLFRHKAVRKPTISRLNSVPSLIQCFHIHVEQSCDCLDGHVTLILTIHCSARDRLNCDSSLLAVTSRVRRAE